MDAKGLCSALVFGLVLWPMTASMGTAQSVAVREESVTGKRQTLITVSVKQAPLAQILREIAAQAFLSVAFPARVIQSPVRVTLDVHDEPLDQVLAKVLDGTGLKATVASGGIFFAEVADAAKAPVTQGSISGKVVDGKTRRGLRGATITLVGTNKGTTSSDDGTFHFLDVVPGSYTIQVRVLGYVKTTKAVTVTDGQTAFVEVLLEPSVNALDQIVVTGTVVQTALKGVPSAITVITAKEIEDRGITRIDQLFRGDVPGLFAPNMGSFSALDSVVMFSRGATALSVSSAGTRDGTNPIKTYVDGIELANPSYLSQIDPRSIERVEILSGPQASTIYGSNALNGVMQIFTKRHGVSKPQLTLSLASGVIENDNSSALAPNHAVDARISGMEGRWAYSAGGSVDYAGAWTPGKQTVRYSGSGGGRMTLPMLTVDISFRQALTQNVEHGARNLLGTMLASNGTYAPSGSRGRRLTQVSKLSGQTGGINVTLIPLSWWSHDLVIGVDASNPRTAREGSVYTSPVDSMLSFSETRNSRMSQRYATTAHIRVSSVAYGTLSLGADHWRTQKSVISGNGMSLVGSLSSASISRSVPGKNTGGFVQAQLGMWDALFLTYGLRAEWNPNYGDEAQPNLAPRYGIAYTNQLGNITMKWRASYGRSTRPPQEALKESVPSTSADNIARYGEYDTRQPNPDLGPEFQQGGEGGMELYIGNRGSLVITRYNQTVDALIASVSGIDSVRSLQLGGAGAASACTPASDGYCYARQSRYLNVGSIRNQGWEAQGSVNMGSWSARGTYSWTKSRVIGVNSRYRPLLSASVYAVGKSFQYFPEHTWALTVGYAKATSMIGLTVNGTGQLTRDADYLSWMWYETNAHRISTSVIRWHLVNGYQAVGSGYAQADLNATHRLAHRVEGTLNIQNLTNYYRNDRDVQYPTAGRQTKAGLRIRW